MGFFSWKTLGTILAIAAGAIGVASSVVDDKKRKDEIREEVQREFDRRND